MQQVLVALFRAYICAKSYLIRQHLQKLELEVLALACLMLTVAAASVFCAPGIALEKDPGQASLSKQHKGDYYIVILYGHILWLVYGGKTSHKLHIVL